MLPPPRRPDRPRPQSFRPEPPPAPEPIPDRSLDPPAVPTTIAIRSNGLHPFVYRKMVDGPIDGPRPYDGDLVRIVDRDRIPLGYGLWNNRSQIALRILSHGDVPPGPEFWHGRIDDAVALRRDILKLDDQGNSYRVIHAEADGLSGLIVDRFDDTLSVEVFSLGMYQRLGPLMAHLSERLDTTHWHARVDERIALAEDFAGRPVASPGAPSRVTIREHGIRYRVQFEGGHKTGFFCDQRENRFELARYCQDQQVLDVCSYTGGFAINAMVRGGASEVTAVDLDEKAIAVARENANLNQVRIGLVHSDAFGYLRQMAVNEREYGVVVLDPPKLIPMRTEIAGGKRKYFDLNVLAMNVVRQGGLLLTCSCSGLLSPEEFLVLLRAAARKAGRSIRILAFRGASSDHPIGLEALEGAYLKAAWLWVGERHEIREGTAEESDEPLPPPGPRFEM